MADKMSTNIERTASVIDLLSAVVFLAILVKLYAWVDGFLGGLI